MCLLIYAAVCPQFLELTAPTFAEFLYKRASSSVKMYTVLCSVTRQVSAAVYCLFRSWLYADGEQTLLEWHNQFRYAVMLPTGLDPRSLLQERGNWEARYLMKEHRRAGKATFQGQVYNFLERPTGWKCFMYHISVWVLTLLPTCAYEVGLSCYVIWDCNNLLVTLYDFTAAVETP